MERSGANRRHRMKTARSTLRTMRQVIPLCLLVLIVRTKAQAPQICISSPTNRPPKNSDINVTCGTNDMELVIYICPIYQALYNESLVALNGHYDIAECYGTPNWTATPPELKFTFPLNTSSVSACGNTIEITKEVGKGDFSDFSMIQFAYISGTVSAYDPAKGMITFRRQILYKFSCRYPLQYLLNNTQLAVSGVNLAINDNNGTFAKQIILRLFADENRQDPLVIPELGLDIKTRVYAAVQAINITKRFNVLLDRCFATTEPYPSSNNSYDLLVGCTRGAQTVDEENGISQTATFSFEAFRFVAHRNKQVSTFYLHCATRLCDVRTCADLLPNCSNSQNAQNGQNGQSGQRRKREAKDELPSTTVSSGAIRVGKTVLGDNPISSASKGKKQESVYSSPVVAVIICLVILTILFFAMSAYFIFYIRRGRLITP